MKVLRRSDPDWESAIRQLELRGERDLSRVEPAVQSILRDVRDRGDAAVLDACARFEHRTPMPLFFELGERGDLALARMPRQTREVLESAANRIRAFHTHQLDAGFRYRDGEITLGTRVLPLRTAGVYAPGGKARYPSSVLMSAIPARTAGVKRVVLATPLSGTADDDLILAAAALSGVDSILDAGGAQAVAALAYGTSQCPRVDIVVGPGNIYVACAKRLVSGHVRIDGIAGPSEILVLADRSASPEYVAADLLSQAEHDEAAYPLLATTDESILTETLHQIEVQIATLPRRQIAQDSLSRQGHAIVVENRGELAEVANAIAAEHLALHVEHSDELLEHIDSAGAAFLGSVTPEACGDYFAGPSHVLPTGGAVRFGSPLGIYDFYKRTSIVQYSRAALKSHADAITTFARLEHLEAHARAIEIRLKS